MVQAATIVLLARRWRAGRVVVGIFLILSATALPLALAAIERGAYGIAAYLVAGFVLKAAAAALLFTSASNRWFTAGV
jgi:hypothetical protein